MAKQGPAPKLSEKQKREIIMSRLSPAELAKMFGVGQTTIYRIIATRSVLK
jgi:predicted DNA-binding transcriptional regulator AlpA